MRVSDDNVDIKLKKQHAQEAMANRGKKKVDDMSQYYYVIGGFVVICIVSIGITLFSPKQKFAEMKIIDES
jgi:hypothetical protein